MKKVRVKEIKVNEAEDNIIVLHSDGATQINLKEIIHKEWRNDYFSGIEHASQIIFWQWVLCFTSGISIGTFIEFLNREERRGINFLIIAICSAVLSYFLVKGIFYLINRNSLKKDILCIYLTNNHSLHLIDNNSSLFKIYRNKERLSRILPDSEEVKYFGKKNGIFLWVILSIIFFYWGLSLDITNRIFHPAISFFLLPFTPVVVGLTLLGWVSISFSIIFGPHFIFLKWLNSIVDLVSNIQFRKVFSVIVGIIITGFGVLCFIYFLNFVKLYFIFEYIMVFYFIGFIIGAFVFNYLENILKKRNVFKKILKIGIRENKRADLGYFGNLIIPITPFHILIPNLFERTPSLQSDKEIALDVVRFNMRSMKFVHNDFKKDKEFVITAVKSNGFALQFASEELKNNNHIVLEAIKYNGEALNMPLKASKMIKKL
jgi:hypothetical protein